MFGDIDAAIAILAGLTTVLATYLSIALTTLKRIRDIASWRQRVEDALEARRAEMGMQFEELCRRIGHIEEATAKREARIDDLSDSIRTLAEVAGRALGRTERGE